MGKFIIANRFEINDLEKDLLGRGGMGVVYRATDNQSGETVAVKTLNSETLSHEPNILERFQREGDALRQLNHPNIVKFITAIESHGQHYLVMEYVDGGSLQSLLAKHGQLSSQRSVEIGLDLADALTRAHHLGIVYRDLKPANVLLAQDGTPRLTDFGIAQLADSSRLTQTGVLVGTVNYLSPEALSGEVLDFRTDIWAFGVLMFEMLTGKLPFTGENLTARITATLTQPVPDLTRYDLDIPKPLAGLIYRMLEKDRRQRIPSMRQVGAELETMLNGWKGNPISSASRFESPSLFTQNANHELPTGTVTFLFTDIEGSTKLAQQYPESMPGLLARHNEILNQAVESHNGFVFQVVGDSCAAAFHNANDAVNAALEAQRKLHNEAWAPSPIKVRMGIHTGAAQLQIESKDTPCSGYATLALTQRISSAGHGGQILLSQAAENLLRGQLPKDATLRDMGEKNLKDIFLPERIYQLNVPDLPSEFPALKTYEKTRHNLPLQLTTFIGREKEVEQIKKRLEKNHLVTLTGWGGIGKTRLSIQVASELLPEYPIGVWLVELAPLTDPALVPQSVCAALGVTPEGGTSPLDALINYMRAKKILLVVDNCEHLIDACAQLCDSLLHACPDLRIITSSREALGIEGENAHRVPSLSLPDPKSGLHVIERSESVKLFMERAAALLPEFEMTEVNAPAIAQICKRLDGIALAIELAASRVKMLNVEQIATRLDDAFRLLTGGSRTALPRQQTLRALIDWSYNLLSDEERTFLRKLSIFMGGWTLEGAEEVCGNSDALDLLTHLVDKSLVSVDLEHGDEPRYYLLETIRQYAREKSTESGESGNSHKRHAAYFFQLAQKAKPELNGPNQQVWFERLEQEIDNSRFALNWLLENDIEVAVQLASGLFWFWHTYCYWSEGREWYQRFLKDQDEQNHLPVIMKAQVLSEAGWLAADDMDTNQSMLLSKQSLALYREVGNRHGMAMALNTLGWIAYYLNDYSHATTLGKESLNLYQELGINSKFESELTLLGCIARAQGYYDQAMELFKESLKWARDVGGKAEIAYSLSQLGFVAWYQGDLEQAAILTEESLQLSREIRLGWNVAETLNTLGDIARTRGEYEQASRFYDESNVIWERLGHKREIGYLLYSRGWLARLQGDYIHASSFFTDGLRLWQEVGDRRHTAECLEGLAGVELGFCKAELSAKLMGTAEIIREETSSPLPPVDRANYELDVAALRSQLGESNFTTAWAEGRAMTVDQAIELALEKHV